jgi:hypothetical protein
VAPIQQCGASTGLVNVLGYGSDNQVVQASVISLLPTGNVGIGTTNPLSLLHVNGAITASGTIYTSTASGASIWMQGNGGSSIYITDSPSNPIIGTTTYGRYFGTTASIYQDFYGTFVWRNTTVQGAVSSTIMNLSGTTLTVFGNVNLTGSVQYNGVSITTGTGSIWTAGGSGVAYYNGGNVGIGTATPTNLLTINTGVLEVNDGTTSGKYGIYSYNGDFFINPRTSSGGFTGTQGFRMFSNGNISSSGNIGIGMATPPTAQLHLSNTIVNRKIVLYDDVNNDHQFYGFGINAGVLRYQGASHVFFSAVNASSSKELMRINGNGTISIGGTFAVEGTDAYQTVGLSLTNTTGTLTSWQFSTAGSSGPQTQGAYYIYGNRITVNGGFALVMQPTSGNLYIAGALSKGSGTFDIEHPLYPNTNKRLVHSFIEGPRCDLIYRGTVALTNGSATVYIDKQCTYTQEDAMDNGTFEALCANPDIFLQNRTGFNRVVGSIYRGILTITSENNTATDMISWMVIAERKDPFVKNWDRTDSNGYLNTQYTKDN